MTRPDEYTVYQATDPSTPPDVLEAMAGARPDLRQFVAANPATAPEVLGWLAGFEESAIDAALRRRHPTGAPAPWVDPSQSAGGAQQPSAVDRTGAGPSVPGPSSGFSVGVPGPAGPVPDPYAPSNPYATPGAPSAGSPHPYAPPTAPPGPYGGPGAPPNPYGGPGAPPNPYGGPGAPPSPYPPPGPPPVPPAGPVGQPGPFAPQYVTGPGQPYGYPAGPGYMPTQPPTGNRTWLIVAIVVGAVVLIGALIFAATSIFGSLRATDYGDDADLDALWVACEGGDGGACDDLYQDSPFGSRYEEYGDTCGDRLPAGTVWCDDVMDEDDARGDDYGDDAELDLLWDDCEAGEGTACDDLYRQSPIGSRYEEFGDTCGERIPAQSAWCEEVI